MSYSVIAELQHVNRFDARSPISIDCPKDRLVSLTFQIGEFVRVVKNIKYHIRIAKRQSRYHDERSLQTVLQAEKFKLKVLRNQRNYLYKRLTNPAPTAPYEPPRAHWITKSRREQHESVEASRRSDPAFARNMAADTAPH